MSNDEQTLSVTIAYDDQRADIVVSASLPVAELLPGIIAHLGRLNATSATYGFDVATSSGRLISQGQSLAAQHVTAGTVLTLTSRSYQELPRYDDLAEAVGTIVESSQQPWGRPEAMRLASWCSAALSVTAAALLTVRGSGSSAAIIAGCVATVIVVVAAGAISRMDDMAMNVSLFIGACALLAATGWNLAAGYDLPWRAMAVAGGILVATLGVCTFPRAQWPIAFGTLTLGVLIVIASAIVGQFSVTWGVAAGVTLAVAMGLEALLPSIGLALIPARRQALTLDSLQSVPSDEVDAQVKGATLAVTAMRLGVGVTVVVFAPTLIHNWWGVLLLACCALSLALVVRNLYSRIDVYTNTVVAIVTVLVAAVTASLVYPTEALVLCGALVVCVILLVLQSLAPSRYRPGLDRILDAVYAVATIAVVPLAVLNWGIF